MIPKILCYEGEETEYLCGFPKGFGSIGFYEDRCMFDRTYPEKFKKYMESLKPGDIFSVVDGKTYLCRENSATNFSVEYMNEGNSMDIVALEQFGQGWVFNKGTDYWLEVMYQKNSKELSKSVEIMKKFSIKEVHEQVRSLERDVSESLRKRVKMGRDWLEVRMSEDNDKIQWYRCKDDMYIFRSQVIVLLCYLNSNPIQTKYIRTNHLKQDNTQDKEMQRTIEELFENESYARCYDKLLAYSEQEKTDLVIRTDYYYKNSVGSYKAGSVFFRDGKAYKAEYYDDDFSKENCRIVSLKSDEFLETCKLLRGKGYQRFSA